MIFLFFLSNINLQPQTVSGGRAKLAFKLKALTPLKNQLTEVIQSKYIKIDLLTYEILRSYIKDAKSFVFLEGR